MLLKNLSKNTILSKDTKKVDSLIGRAFGLLKKSNPRSLLFETRFGIHTFFMQDKIDVIVLDNNFKVAKIRKNLLPNRLFFWNPVYRYVLELPDGVVEKTRTEVGDKIGYNQGR